MTKNELFTEYVERGLVEGFSDREELARKIYKEFEPAGGMLLGHCLLQQGYLPVDRKKFAKELVAESFEAMLAIKEKDSWDYYYIAVAHAYGRGTAFDYSKAATAYAESDELGNPYANFEAIWARFLSGGSRMLAILEFNAVRGKLAHYAGYAARALMLLELGAAEELGSRKHIATLILSEQALDPYIYYHDHGGRQIIMALQKAMREDVEALKQMKTKRANLALYLTSRLLSRNTTGKEPSEWLKIAIDPEIEELSVLCQRVFNPAQVKMILKQAEKEGWQDSELVSTAKAVLRGEKS